jgi:sulfatase maturation enzyme AslB (radical SAM superfamily)
MLGLSSGSGAQVITPSGAPLHIKNNGDVEYWHSCLGNIYSQDLGLFQDLGLLLERKGEAEKKLLGSRGKCWEKCEWGNICGGGDNKFFYKGQNLLCSAYKKIFLKLQELIKNVKPYITQEDGDRSKGV